VQGVDDLLDDKIKLVRAYETRLKAFQEDPGQLNTVDDDLRQELAETGQQLSELMQENASLLESAVSASRSVVEAFVEAVREDQSGTTYYDESAVLASERTRPGARGAALTVDQTL